MDGRSGVLTAVAGVALAAGWLVYAATPGLARAESGASVPSYCAIDPVDEPGMTLIECPYVSAGDTVQANDKGATIVINGAVDGTVNGGAGGDSINVGCSAGKPGVSGSGVVNGGGGDDQ